MASQPNRLPSQDLTPKQPQKAKKEPKCRPAVVKPREWRELDTALRAGTDYKRETDAGWGPVYYAWTADMCRLASGAACWALVSVLWVNLMRQRAKGQVVPEECWPMLVAELASLCQVDERTINRELQYLSDRGMAVVARLAGGKVVVKLQYRQWPAIEQSYREWAAARKETLEEQEQENAAETPVDQPVRPGSVEIAKQVSVKPGHRSRSIPVNTGVRSIRVHWQNKILDLKFSAVVDSGELVVTGWTDEKQQSSAKAQKSSPQPQQNTTTSERGHICPEFPSNEGTVIPSSEGIEKKAKKTSHPRGEELAKLFDPLILPYCRKTLSGDPQALLQSCEAIGETPHDYLVQAAVERGARPINRPKSVVAICREIEHNWRAGTSIELPVPLKLPTMEEINAIIEQEDRELKAKRAALRKKRA